jgi:hypothetical protein
MLDFFVLINLLKSTLIPYPLYIFFKDLRICIPNIYILWESTNHSEQGRWTTLWHARSIRFPRPYHHLTSNFKLYPISHLKPIGTYTGQLNLPYRIYCPNCSLYMSFRTEHCWKKLCLTEAGECKKNALISLFFYFYFYFLLANRGGIWCPTSGDSETRAAHERLRTKYSNPKYYTHLVHPGVGLIRPTVLKDRETRLSANGTWQ